MEGVSRNRHEEEAAFERLRELVDDWVVQCHRIGDMLEQTQAQSGGDGVSTGLEPGPVRVRVACGGEGGPYRLSGRCDHVYSKTVNLFCYLSWAVEEAERIADTQFLPELLWFGEESGPGPGPPEGGAMSTTLLRKFIAMLPLLRILQTFLRQLEAVLVNLLEQVHAVCTDCDLELAEADLAKQLREPVMAAAGALAVMLRTQLVVAGNKVLQAGLQHLRQIMLARTEADAEAQGELLFMDSVLTSLEDALYTPGPFQAFLNIHILGRKLGAKLSEESVLDVILAILHRAASTLMPKPVRSPGKRHAGAAAPAVPAVPALPAALLRRVLSLAILYSHCSPRHKRRRRLLKLVLELAGSFPVAVMHSRCVLMTRALLLDYLSPDITALLPRDFRNASAEATAQAFLEPLMFQQDAQKLSLEVNAWLCCMRPSVLVPSSRQLWGSFAAATVSRLHQGLHLLQHTSRLLAVLLQLLQLHPSAERSWMLRCVYLLASLLAAVASGFDQLGPTLPLLLSGLATHFRSELMEAARQLHRALLVRSGAAGGGPGARMATVSTLGLGNGSALPLLRRERGGSWESGLELLAMLQSAAAGHCGGMQQLQIRCILDHLQVSGVLPETGWAAQQARAAAQLQLLGSFAPLTAALAAAPGLHWQLDMVGRVLEEVGCPSGSYEKLPFFLSACRLSLQGAAAPQSVLQDMAHAFDRRVGWRLEVHLLKPAAAAVEALLDSSQDGSGCDLTAAHTLGGGAAGAQRPVPERTRRTLQPLQVMGGLRLMTELMLPWNALEQGLSRSFYNSSNAQPARWERYADLALFCRSNLGLQVQAPEMPPRQPEESTVGLEDVLPDVGAFCEAYCFDLLTNSFMEAPEFVEHSQPMLHLLTASAIVASIRARGLGIVPATVDAINDLVVDLLVELGEALTQDKLASVLQLEKASLHEGAGFHPLPLGASACESEAPDGGDRVHRRALEIWQSMGPGPTMALAQEAATGPMDELRVLITVLGNSLALLQLLQAACSRFAYHHRAVLLPAMPRHESASSTGQHASQPHPGTFPRTSPPRARPPSNAMPSGTPAWQKLLGSTDNPDELAAQRTTMHLVTQRALENVAELCMALAAPPLPSGTTRGEAEVQERPQVATPLQALKELIRDKMDSLNGPLRQFDVVLRDLYLLVPALMHCYVEAMLLAKERLCSRTNDEKAGALADDGFSLGLAFLINVLDIGPAFQGLNAFRSARQYHLNCLKEMKPVPAPEASGRGSSSSSSLHQPAYSSMFSQQPGTSTGMGEASELTEELNSLLGRTRVVQVMKEYDLLRCTLNSSIIIMA